jgi:hypothetical protein
MAKRYIRIKAFNNKERRELSNIIYKLLATNLAISNYSKMFVYTKLIY